MGGPSRSGGTTWWGLYYKTKKVCHGPGRRATEPAQRFQEPLILVGHADGRKVGSGSILRVRLRVSRWEKKKLHGLVLVFLQLLLLLNAVLSGLQVFIVFSRSASSLWTKKQGKKRSIAYVHRQVSDFSRQFFVFSAQFSCDTINNSKRFHTWKNK